MASFVIQVVTPIVGSLAFEQFYLRINAEQLYETILTFPRAFSGVIAVNLIGSSLLLLKLKRDVSKAHKIDMWLEIKAKDDDPSDNEHYAYPKDYAEGFYVDETQVKCLENCYKRVLETYPQFLILSLIGSLQFPITATIGGLSWIIERYTWAQGSATKASSHWMWWGLVCQILATTGTITTLIINEISKVKTL